jgi:hypothetical protein
MAEEDRTRVQQREIAELSAQYLKQQSGEQPSVALSVEPLLKGVVLSTIGLELPEQTSFEQWQSIGCELGRRQKASSWCIGDWWLHAEKREAGKNWSGDRKRLVQSEGWTGPSFQACMDCATVCRKFLTSRRHEALSFNHHREVAALDCSEADELLDWCEAPLRDGTGKPKTIKILREEMQRRGFKSAAPADSKEEIDDDEPSAAEIEVADPASQALFDKVFIAHPRELSPEEIEGRELWQRLDELELKLKARQWFGQLSSLEARRSGIQKLENWAAAFEREFPESGCTNDFDQKTAPAVTERL